MKFELTKRSRVLCYGLMTEQGSFYTEQSIVYGTNFVAGVQPGQGGTKHMGLPVFDSIKDALAKTRVDACTIYGSKASAAKAMEEAIAAGIKVITCSVGGIPVLDMLKIKEKLRQSSSILIGPSSLGLIIPGQCKLGVIPEKIAKKGVVGLITRHGSLTFEVLNQLMSEDMGISMCLSLGSEIVKGMGLVDAFKVMQQDANTKIIIVLANISGFDEERLAAFYNRLPQRQKKPVVVYMAGSFYDFMGKTTYKEQVPGDVYMNTDQKKEMFYNAGMAVIESPAIIAKTAKKILNNEVYISPAPGIQA